jgi:hypothetical protein
VGVSGKSSRVRLFQPESGLDPINYLTLSHRWGTQILFTLTTLNIREMGRQIPLRHLSITFRGAIEITRRLGIRCLWIDSLCIIQDSPQDWRSESARMGDVYKFAYCNLSATRASGGSYDGLYVHRDRLTVKPLYFRRKLVKQHQHSSRTRLIAFIESSKIGLKSPMRHLTNEHGFCKSESCLHEHCTSVVAR